MYKDLPFYQGPARKCLKCGHVFKQGEVVIVISNTEVLCYDNRLNSCYNQYLFHVHSLESPASFMRFKELELAKADQPKLNSESKKLVDGSNDVISPEAFEKLMKKLWGSEGGGKSGGVSE